MQITEFTTIVTATNESWCLEAQIVIHVLTLKSAIANGHQQINNKLGSILTRYLEKASINYDILI
jgi:hypothetical protein